MPGYTVKIKWGKETYQDVEVNTDEDPILFKAQIFALTGVQPERQKVMCKGATLKDDGWGNVKLANGCMVLVMGSKEEDVPVEPVEKPRFVEDMNETELATVLNMPGGLINLGNTCYMNATVQCLKTVPELCDALGKYNQGSDPSEHAELTAAMREFVSTTSGPLGSAARLLRCLHAAAPRFAERQPGGGFAQQDASECWAEIVRAMQNKLSHSGNSKFKSVIEQYFGGVMEVELMCSEVDEDPKKSKEDFLQLSCFISQDVKYLQSGLKSKMQEQITKMSDTLGRDAVYTKTSMISRLPAYLTVQFVRFYYKEKEAINAKILKDVKFPLQLDVNDLCTPELQQRLNHMRSKFKALEDAKVEDSLKAENTAKENSGSEKNQVAKQDPNSAKETLPYWFEDDVGSNNSGFYTLRGVLTHRGRSSSSGHYVAWVKHNATDWVRCDDDVVTPVTEEEVLKLSGGGDWHCAYVLLYGPRVLEVSKDSMSTSEDTPMTS